MDKETNLTDDLDYVSKIYGNKLYRDLKTTDYGIGFFSESEVYVDTIEPLNEGNIKSIHEKSYTVFQDFAFRKGDVLTDYNICKIKIEDKEYKFIKIITSFLRERSYDFIVARQDEMETILKELSKRRSSKRDKAFEYKIIGIDFKELKENTIDFLLNEDFRNFCKERDIPLKRGLILSGVPGVGKTLSLKWLKNEAKKNDIDFYSFKDPDDFLKNCEDYYSDEKSIFVFEDFDALLQERSDTNYSPNIILGKVLNILDGVDEINEVVSIFTTNKIDLFDSAFIRPGRIDKVIHYEMPSKENKEKFLNSYLPDFRDYHKAMLDELEKASCDITYAILKGICDDINIYMFHSDNKEMELKEVLSIMKKKVIGSNKNKEVKNNDSYLI